MSAQGGPWPSWNPPAEPMASPPTEPRPWALRKADRWALEALARTTQPALTLAELRTAMGLPLTSHTSRAVRSVLGPLVRVGLVVKYRPLGEPDQWSITPEGHAALNS